MIRNLTRLIKTLFRYFGFNITRHNPNCDYFIAYDIDLIIDVGANEGQFAQEARDLGYTGNILSFEPLSKAHAVLLENAKRDERWHVYERCGVGAVPDTLELNVSGNSVSSSFLLMEEAHSQSAPDSVYVYSEKAKVITLDSLMDTFFQANERIYLKVDTQGFEEQVLQGSQDLMKKVQAIQLELSLVPLYEGTKDYRYFVELMKDYDFHLWSLTRGFMNPNNGRLLQVDAVFRRGSIS